MDRVTIVCSHCGGADVMRDAWAVWNDDEQAWELGHVFDAGHCEDCEGEASLEERPLKDQPAAPSPQSASDSYLERFPPEHRGSADRAYQDGFADGANAADDGDDSEDEAAPAVLKGLVGVLQRAESFITGFADDEGQEGLGDLLDDLEAAIARCSEPQSASPDPEGQSAPALRLFYIVADNPDGESLDAFSWGATPQEAVSLWFDTHNPNNDTAERPRVFECPTGAAKAGPVAWEEIRSWEY